VHGLPTRPVAPSSDAHADARARAAAHAHTHPEAGRRRKGRERGGRRESWRFRVGLPAALLTDCALAKTVLGRRVRAIRHGTGMFRRY